MYNNQQLNEALAQIDYLIYILPKLMYYEPTIEYENAFNIIKNYIKEKQEKLEDN